MVGLRWTVRIAHSLFHWTGAQFNATNTLASNRHVSNTFRSCHTTLKALGVVWVTEKYTRQITQKMFQSKVHVQITSTADIIWSTVTLVATMFGLYPLLYAYVRPLVKWFLRRFTRLCELQRICYGYEKGASRKKAIEQSLDLSRMPRIKSIIVTLNDSITRRIVPTEFHDDVVPQAVSNISATKRIKAKCHPDFGKLLGPCIESIWNYRRLCAEVDDIRQVPYDNLNDEHEAKLLRLWNLLMPTQPLERRVSKQWQDIGFQGDDPMTDFRGMFWPSWRFCYSPWKVN